MSMDDLISRVQGMGDRAAKELSNILRFDLVENLVGEMLMVTADFGVNLRKLMSVQPGGTVAAKLESSLEAIAVTCAADRHPYEEAGLQYQMSVPDDESEFSTADIRILFGAAYYSVLPELFRLASTSIAVCMFHIALPEESHPTKALLNELVTAKSRGVEVRVLMDADRPSDQYRSTVINTNAKEFLKAEGVLVRFDPPGKLLHSKFIVIDKKLIILGSHNWSAGSYFQFDDISLIIISDTLATKQSERFELQWQAGS